MKSKILLVATLAAALAACSSTPEPNATLDRATARYATARADSQVAGLAPDELKRAGDSVRVATQAQSDGDSSARVEHLAYMANQRVTIAEATAASRSDQQQTAGASADRDRMRLEMRTDETDNAQRKLEASRQDAARSDARVSDLEAQLLALNAKMTDRGMVLTLGDVLFRTGESRLSPASANDMNKLAEFFRNNPQSTAKIEGHTDNVGNANSNYLLSERRANAVMMALVNLGVPADRLSMQAFGEDSPTASNADARGRQMNRRVEIVFPRPVGGPVSAR